MLKELLRPEIIELIEKRKWSNLKDILPTWPSPEIADLLLDLPKYDRVLLFRALPRDISAEVFSHLDYEQRDALLHELTDQETRTLLEDLPPDDRTDLLEELPSKVVRRMLNLLSPDDLKEARELLGYPEESIGRKMTPDFVAVGSDWKVKDALDHIRKFGQDSETIYRIYVTDEDGKLLDDILLRSIIMSDENESISKLMDYNVVSLSAFDDQEEAVKVFEKYDLFAIPVVDSEGSLVGIVTFDDVLDISSEEATEDFQKIGGINPVDQSYITASLSKLWIKRIPWLVALLFINFITAGVIKHYEFVLSQVVALAIFIPMLIGTAGNTGMQSATLVIRSLALQEITTRDWWRIFRKEIIIGLAIGVFLGLFTYLRGTFENTDEFNIAIVVSIAMLMMVVWANLVGSLLPLILSKFKLDPAVISSPFMATFIDISGIFIYFNIAIYFLKI